MRLFRKGVGSLKAEHQYERISRSFIKVDNNLEIRSHGAAQYEVAVAKEAWPIFLGARTRGISETLSRSLPLFKIVSFRGQLRSFAVHTGNWQLPSSRKGATGV